MRAMAFCTLVALFACASAGAEESERLSLTTTCQKPSAESPAMYPAAAKAAKRRGTTMLRVDIDACGRVLDLEVETSAGDPDMDQAALEAARTWHFGSEAEEGGAPVQTTVMPGQLLVPVMFRPNAPRFGPHFELLQWRRLQIGSKVPVDEQGLLPGYIRDPEPIAPGKIADVIAMLEANGRRLPDDVAGVRRYELSDGWLNTGWEVFESGLVFSPSVARTRLASDGEKAFWVTSGLCEAQESGACEKFEEFLSLKASQKPGPPPPPPPPGTLEHFGY